MNKKNIGLNFDLKFKKIQNLNPSFDLARVAIAYAGRNRNKSVISKEVFEKAIPTIYNIPLVGRYIPEEDDFGSHDVMLTTDEDGNYKIENATVPFGVIPESSDIAWETVTEEDGTEREYLFANCVLWKRSYGYEKLVSQDCWHQSMEIEVTDYELDDSKYMVINNMIFTALCILGNDVEPCFESASVQIGEARSDETFSSQFALMLDDFKNLKSQAIELQFSESCEEGGTTDLDTANVEVTELEEVTEQTEETTEVFAEEATAEVNVEETFESETTEENQNNENSENYELASSYIRRLDSIREALLSMEVCTETEYVSYWLADADEEYAYVERYACVNKKRKKTYGRFACTVDEDCNVTLGEYTEMFITWLTAEEVETVRREREADKEELANLRAFRDERLRLDHENEVNELVSEFSDITETEEFSAISGQIYEFEVETLREKLYAIKGRHAVVKTEKENTSQNVKIPVGTNYASNTNETKNEYGDLFARFAKKK